MNKLINHISFVAPSSLFLFPINAAFAQNGAQTSGPPADSPVTIQVASIVVNALTPILIGVITAFINRHVKNQQMATLLSNAVQNSLGIVQQQIARSGDGTLTFDVRDPRLRQAIQNGANYVTQHAGEAKDYFGIDNSAIEQKIEAKLGLAAMATNLAETASPSPIVAGPLSPVPLIGKAPMGG
jgi:hypothetical protein